MPSKDGSGFPLPDVSDAERICIQVSVPNQREHVGAFMGSLQALGMWFNWARDDAHFGKDVAKTWQAIFEETSARYSAGEFFVGDCMTFCDEVDTCPPKVRQGINGLEWFNPALGLWQPLPGDTNDPRTNGTVTPPYITVPAGQTGNCLAAANIVDAFKNIIKLITSDALHTFATTYDVNQYIRGQAGLTFTVTPALDAAINNFVVTVTGIEIATITADATDDQYTKIDCLLSCNIDGNGFISDDGYNEIHIETASLNSTMQAILDAWLYVFGINGLMKLETISGILSADCTDCECGWVHEFDFALGDAGWDKYLTFSNYGGLSWDSVFNPSSGGVQQNYIWIILPSNRTVNRMDIDWSAEDLDAGGANGIFRSWDSNNGSGQQAGTQVGNGDATGSGSFLRKTDHVFFDAPNTNYVLVSTGGADPAHVGRNSTKFYKITLHGEGTDPF